MMRLLIVLSALLTAMVSLGTPATALARPTCVAEAAVAVQGERSVPVTITVAAPGKHAESCVNFVNFQRAEPLLKQLPLYANRLRV